MTGAYLGAFSIPHVSWEDVLYPDTVGLARRSLYFDPIEDTVLMR
ncbi:hypothetical protein AB0M44_33740 [Streptosporangium subroseum]